MAVLAQLAVLVGAVNLAKAAIVNGVQAQRGSLVGGTFLTVWGQGFNRNGRQGETVVYVGGTLAEKVSYYSSDNKLVVYTPNLGLTSDTAVDVRVQLVTMDTGEAHDSYAGSTCSGGQPCKFTYAASNTPRIDYSSLGGHAGSRMRFTGQLLGSTTAWYEIHIGDRATGYRCEPLEEGQAPLTPGANVLWDSANGALKCLTPISEAGVYNVSFEVRDPSRGTTNGYGQAVRTRLAKQAARADGLVHHVTISPVVNSIDVHSSGLMGGQPITISGAGFSTQPGGNTVQLLAGDGAGSDVWVPCAITTSSPSSITCVPGPVTGGSVLSTAVGNMPRVFSGGAGLQHDVYKWVNSITNNIYTADFTAGGLSNLVYPPLASYTDTDSIQSWCRSEGAEACDYYANVFKGFFVPPVTANYSFMMRCDDYCIATMAPDDSFAKRTPLVSSTSYTDGFWWQTGQVTYTPVYLQAGKRYAFQLQHAEKQGLDNVELAVRIHTTGNAQATAKFRSANQRTFASVPEVQRIVTSNNAAGGSPVREQQTVVVAGAQSSGTWGLSVGDKVITAYDSAFTWGAAAATVETAIRNYLLGVGYSCYDVAVTRSNYNQSQAGSTTRFVVGFQYVFTFNCPPASSAMPYHKDVAPVAFNVVPVSGLADVVFTTARTRPASVPLDGFFVLGYLPPGTSASVLADPVAAASAASWATTVAAYNADSNGILSALNSIPGFPVGSVETQRIFGADARDGSTWQVTFYGQGDVPTLLVKTLVDSNPGVPTLTGTNASVSVLTHYDGSSDPFLWPVPMAGFFEAPHPSVPAVRVTSNGLLAACSAVPDANNASAMAAGTDAATACAFRYDASLTPNITGISPATVTAGAVLVVTGTGFLPASAGFGRGRGGLDVPVWELNSVIIGPASAGNTTRCNVTAASATSLTCTVPDAPAGGQPIRVLVSQGRGLASYAAGVDPVIQYTGTVTSVTPSSGSTAGGTVLVIKGTGFGLDVAGNAVSVGGFDCPVVSANPAQVMCRTPAGTGSGLAVSVNGYSLTAAFSYASSVTPVLSAMSPATLPAGVTGIVNVSIALPAAAGGTLPAGTTIAFGDRPCMPKANYSLTGNSVLASCTLVRGPRALAPPQAPVAPTVFVPPFGFADNSAALALDTGFRVNGVSNPGAGSILGGTPVTIAGYGLTAPIGSWEVHWYPAGVGHSSANSSAYGYMCMVTGVAADGSHINCTTGAPAAAQVAALKRGALTSLDGYFHVQANNVTAPSATWPTVPSFSYNLAATPIIRTLSVSIATRALVVGGVRLDARGSLALNFNGSAASAVTSAADGASASATLPHMPAGTYMLAGLTAQGRAWVNASAGDLMDAAVMPMPGGGLSYANPLVLYSLEQQWPTASGSTLQGSAFGGHRLILRGWGFAPPVTCPFGTTSVFFTRTVGTTSNSFKAQLLSGSTTELVLRTPPLVSSSGSFSSWGPNAVWTNWSVAAQVMDLPGMNLLAPAQLLLANYTYDATTTFTPRITSVFPTSGPKGTLLRISGVGFLPGGTNATMPNGTSVTVGGATCAIVPASWTAVAFNCTLGDSPGGAHRVLLEFPSTGLARGGSSTSAAAPPIFTVPMTLTTAPAATGGFGGGVSVTITGAGFATMENLATMRVQLCNANCSVTASDYNSVTCTAPPLVTSAFLSTFNTHKAMVLSGRPWASSSLSLTGAISDKSSSNIVTAATVGAAMDGDIENGYTGLCRVGLDMGVDSRAHVSRLRYYARFQKATVFRGGYWQGSLLSPEEARSAYDWVTLGVVPNNSTEGWNSINVNWAGNGVTPNVSFASLPAWRSIQFVYPSGVTCEGMEIQVVGHPVAALSTAACPINVTVAAAADAFTGTTAPVNGQLSGATFQYTAALTPAVTSISPNNGTALGGTVVTLRGTGFGTTTAGVTLSLNGVRCAVASVSSTAISCVTGPRDAIRKPSVSLFIPGSGKATYNETTVFRYLDRWSALTTWANQEPPVEGDTVIVPEGQAILVDVSPPRLFLVYVAGQLVFDRQDLTFNASYFVAHGGSIEAGSEAEPFLNKLTITLHGDRFESIEIPELGAKVLGIMNRHNDMSSSSDSGGMGNQDGMMSSMNPVNMLSTMGDDNEDPSMSIAHLELHGRPRLKVWTFVASTVEAGADIIDTAEDVDWAPGEQVVITSGDWDYSHAEELTVVERISPRQIRVTPPLAFRHESQIVPAGQWGHSDVDMRCEIGLLSRNIVVQGDDNSDSQDFGCHNMAAHGGVFRLENIEIRRCGQSFNLGRYSSHMHMLGTAGQFSYVRYNSIHHSFQRMTTVHATDYSTVEGNFGYYIKGHSLFVEDGVERFNVFQYNLIARTERCYACLKGDMKPASFWTASPTNFWRFNTAAGSVNDGYWLELPGNPHGPSFTTSICPVGAPLGEHLANRAHSNGVKGMRLYPVVTPYNDPCDKNSGSQIQRFYNFTSFRNSDNLFGKRNGPLFHINPKLVEGGAHDFKQIFYEGFYAGQPDLYTDAEANIQNALFIGTLDPVKRPMWDKTGMLTPQDENFFVSGATFVNYGSKYGPITGCAECDSDVFLAQGGYTVRFERMNFVNTAARIRWAPPKKDIFIDLDGTLTSTQPKSTVLPYYAFNSWPECVRDTIMMFDKGHVCNPSVVVRRLQLDGVDPRELDQVTLNVSSTVGSDNVLFRMKESYGWVFPAVTNAIAGDATHEYKLLFKSLVDWRTLRIRYSEPSYVFAAARAGGTYGAGTPGEWTRLTFAWIDQRYRNRVWYRNDYRREVPSLPYGALPGPNDVFGTGTWFWSTNGYVAGGKMLNSTWTVGLSTGNTNGTSMFDDAGQSLAVTVNNIQCAPSMCDVPAASSSYSNFTLWSNPASWQGGRVPQAGDTVTINASQWVVLDISPPPLARLDIIGKLSFQDQGPRVLAAGSIVVWGELQIGTPEAPFVNRAEVVLTGVRTSQAVIVDNNLFAGNKNIVVLGALNVHGAVRNVTWTRLTSTADVGASQLKLNASVTGSWYPGDTLTITPTEWDLPMQEETVTVSDVSSDGRTVTITRPLSYRHYAGPLVHSPSTPAGKAARVAAAVGLLSRNVIIRGNVSSTPLWIQEPNSNKAPYLGPDTYGGHILVAAIARPGVLASQWRIGRADVRYADLRNLGKQGMEHASVLIQYGSHTLDARVTPDATNALGNAVLHPVNRFIGNAFSNCFNYGVLAFGARNVWVERNVLHHPYRNGIELDVGSTNATVIGNLVVDVRADPTVNQADQTAWVWPMAGIFIEAPTVFAVKGNLIAGAADAGISYRPETTCAASGVAADGLGFPSLTSSPAFDDNEVVGAVIGVFLLPTLPLPPARRTAANAWCGLRTGGWRIWKSAHVGLLAVDGLADIAVVNSVLAENHIGSSLNFVTSKRELSRADFVDVTVIGTGPATAPFAPNDMCPPSSVCRAAVKQDVTASGVGGVCNSVLGSAVRRAGILGPQWTNRGKTCYVDGSLPVCRPMNRPHRMCLNALPWERRFGLPSTRFTQLFLTRVTFAGFQGADAACAGPASSSVQRLSRAYVHNPSQVDMAAPVYARGIAWDNTTLAGRFLFSADINPAGLPDFPGGDGLQGLLLQDADGTLTGAGVPSSVLGPNPAVGEDAPTCTWRQDWPGMQCDGSVWRQAVVENMDRDRGHRTLGNAIVARLPAAASNDLGSVNWSNRTSFSRGNVDDHCAMRFYFGQMPFLVRPGSVTHFMLQGTEPGQTRFHFLSPDASESVLLKFFVQRPNSQEIYANGKLVASNAAGKDASQVSVATDLPQLTSGHGANLFSAQARHLSLTLRGQASWGTSPVDVIRLASVQLTLTLSVSVDEFFSGGSAKVVSNLAQLLGIPAERIKVVQVAAASSGSGRLLQATSSSSSSSVQVEILPPPNATVRVDESATPIGPSTVDNSTNTSESSSSVVTGSTNATDAAAAAEAAAWAAATSSQLSLATDMASLATTLATLATSGQLNTVGGYAVQAVSIVAPPVPVASAAEAAVVAATTGVSTGTTPVIVITPGAGSSSGSGKLAGGAIAGIAVGSVCGALLIVGLGFALRRHFTHPLPSSVAPCGGVAVLSSKAPDHDTPAAAHFGGFTAKPRLARQLPQLGAGQQQHAGRSILPGAISSLNSPGTGGFDQVMAFDNAMYAHPVMSARTQAVLHGQAALAVPNAAPSTASAGHDGEQHPSQQELAVDAGIVLPGRTSSESTAAGALKNPSAKAMTRMMQPSGRFTFTPGLSHDHPASQAGKGGVGGIASKPQWRNH